MFFVLLPLIPQIDSLKFVEFVATLPDVDVDSINHLLEKLESVASSITTSSFNFPMVFYAKNLKSSITE
jgi:hypothetical protein